MTIRHLCTALFLGMSLVWGLVPREVRAAENNYIAVIGSGRAEQMPEYAVVSATVLGEGEDTKAAIGKSTDNILKLAGRLEAMDIAKDKMEFLRPSVQQKTDYVRQPGGQYTEVSLGYQATQTLRVTLEDLDQAGTIIRVLTDEGNLAGMGVAYHVLDLRALQKRARDLAIADAVEKAGAYAQAANRRLGNLLIVEESQIGNYRLLPALREEITGEGERGRYSGPVPMSPGSPAPVPLTPQLVSQSVTLYVKFALR